MINFDLKKPCKGCPFRTQGEKRVRFLGEERIVEIVEAMTEQQKTFTCHETLQNERQQHCAGAIVFLNNTTKTGYAKIQWARIAERLSWGKPQNITDPEEVIAKTMEELVNQHTEVSEMEVLTSIAYIIGDRWSPQIIYQLNKGTNNFSQLLDILQIATNVLSTRLVILEENDLINKTRNEQDRRRFIYSLTNKGERMVSIINQMISIFRS